MTTTNKENLKELFGLYSKVIKYKNEELKLYKNEDELYKDSIYGIIKLVSLVFSKNEEDWNNDGSESDEIVEDFFDYFGYIGDILKRWTFFLNIQDLGIDEEEAYEDDYEDYSHYLFLISESGNELLRDSLNAFIDSNEDKEFECNILKKYIEEFIEDKDYQKEIINEAKLFSMLSDCSGHLI